MIAYLLASGQARTIEEGIELALSKRAGIGLNALPWFLLLAFAAGLIGMGAPILLGRKSAATPVPFGPFIAF